MDVPSGDVRTELVDLTGISITDLRECEERFLEPCTRRLLDQIERPRVNLGTGPPGRVD